jgi:hypothetical protein
LQQVLQTDCCDLNSGFNCSGQSTGLEGGRLQGVWRRGFVAGSGNLVSDLPGKFSELVDARLRSLATRRQKRQA